MTAIGVLLLLIGLILYHIEDKYIVPRPAWWMLASDIAMTAGLLMIVVGLLLWLWREMP